MIIVLTIVLLGLVFGLVTWRRRVTMRWRPDAARSVGDPDTAWCTKTWVQKEPPRRSFRAGDRVTGQLCVDRSARIATFRVPDGQHVELANVRRVEMWTSRSEYVNTWIQVDCDVNGARMLVYLNDGGWLGWRPILTSANTRLADALASLIAS